MTRDDFCNCLINWVPIPRLRMAVYRLLGMSVSRGAHMMGDCKFLNMKGITIGERSIIGHDCLLDGRGGIEIGSDVNISSYTKIVTAKHLVNDVNFDGVKGSVRIGRRVWIATGAIIQQDVEVGEGAVVCAGSVVTKNVDAFTVVGGVPAKKIGDRNRELVYELSSKPSRFM